MKKCFFVTPIGAAGSEERRDSDFVMKHFLNPVAEKIGFNVLRADLLNDNGKIDDTIVQQLKDSDLVIIDLTKLNSNVMFEFGIRYGLNKPFIVISQDVNNLPLDVRNIRVLEYTVTAPDIESINAKLEAMITFAMENNSSINNSSYNRGRELGEELIMQTIQTGDFSQIEQFLSIAEKFGLGSKKDE
ncbi:hypothetical protein JMQ84_002389 [Enterococcus hirae]|nr:hypothetical protein [Enterococcus hirae]